MSEQPAQPTLFQNLRSRKLAQWLLAYAAGVWVLLQVLSLLIGAYHWPDGVLRIAIGVAVLGFFFTAVLAWFHGERGMQRATRTEVGLLAVIVAIGGVGIWLGERGRAESAPTAPIAAAAPAQPAVAGAVEKVAANSIAVLPFVNMSSDADNEFFSDGLSEEILNSLARIEGMQVVGRTSSFQFKGKNEDLRGIGEKLGVSTLLEGSVRREGEGERARITAQLIRVSDGFHLWSKTYDRTLQDTLAVQLDIAEQIALAMLGRPDAAAKELDDMDPKTVPDNYYAARVVVSRAQGKSPAEVHASLKDMYRTQAKFSQWRVAEIVEAANAGGRTEANRLAAVMDARPAGPFLLAVLSTVCYCGAAFDIEATPNFKARLAESGLRWPPPPTIAYPAPMKSP